jgi:GNAT superfamily N-acetyltransferase
MMSSSTGLTIRRLESGDLAAALEIQAAAYPAFLRESAEAFASRLDLPGSYCLAAKRTGVLVAYLLAHPWSGQDPPAIGAILAAPPISDVLYIHDLVVSPTERGSGAGRELVLRALELAARDGLPAAELIAVEGAASYWRTLGFADAELSGERGKKVAAYGPGARWMARSIAHPGADTDHRT